MTSTAFLNSLGELSVLLPELMMIGVALLSLLLAITPARHSTKSVYVILWAQIVVLGATLGLFVLNPSNLALPIQNGMLHPNVGHDLARLAIMVVTVLLSWLTKRSGQVGERFEIEYYGVMISASVAFMFALQASNFVSLFVCLEVGSLLMVLLMAMPKAEGLRSGLTYLIQSSFSTISLMWGCVLIYSQVGSLDYIELHNALMANQSAWVLIGAAFILSSICFKLGLFPFTYWMPPVYKGLRLPALGYVATISKLAGVVVLIDLLISPFFALWDHIFPALAGLVIITLIWSALSAMHQTDFRRLLALSGSVHAAFLVAGVLYSQMNILAINAIYFYLLAYISATLLLLYCLIEISPEDFSFKAVKESYNRNPGFAMMMVLSLASMAGLPPMAGFIAKFLFFFNSVRFEEWGLLAAMVSASVIGLYYYASTIFAIIGRHSDYGYSATTPMLRHLPNSTRVITGFLMVIILGLGLVQGQMSLLW